MSEPIVQTLTLAGAPLPLLNVRNPQANLRAALAEVRTTRRPLIIAERGTRPSAVLLDYATWCALAAPPGTGAGAAARARACTVGPPACLSLHTLSARAGDRPARTGVTAAACQPAALSRRAAGLGTLLHPDKRQRKRRKGCWRKRAACRSSICGQKAGLAHRGKFARPQPRSCNV
ncbi:MAG: hypothetical protein NT169_21330 [Chloroflexi bacterium]|nr:hypothetical protein [Chloroflexota bacterium]